MNPVNEIGKESDLISCIYSVGNAIVALGKDIFTIGHILDIEENGLGKSTLPAIACIAEFDIQPHEIGVLFGKGEGIALEHFIA